jgi:hypothetical protein
MSVGDIKWFSQALLNMGTKQFDLSNDTIKVGIVTGVTTPSVDTPDPHWNGTGTTNFAANQVATGAAYTGPISLTNKTWTLLIGGPHLRADIINIAQDASGFTNGAFAILYDDTDTKKRALGYMDLGGALSLVPGPTTIDWNGATNDILQLTAS